MQIFQEIKSHRITSDQFRELVSATNLVLLDVRSNEESDVHRLPTVSHIGIDVINIPWGSLPNRVDELRPFKGRVLVTFCQQGTRAERAQDFLDGLTDLEESEFRESLDRLSCEGSLEFKRVYCGPRFQDLKLLFETFPDPSRLEPTIDLTEELI